MERAELKKLVLATGCAVERGGYVFLQDPKSSAVEQEEFLRVTDLAARGNKVDDGWLCLPTGGTSGGLRFSRHDERTLSAAAQGFCEHFGVSHVNVLDVLPPHHVSGFMARIRCAATGGEHVARSWKQLEAGEWPKLSGTADGWFLSLVPTQLQRLLGSATTVAQLKQFRAVFIGGGPLWPELAEAAATADVPVAICYGMTETAAMVVAQKPGEFASGDRSCGRPMPHARIEIVEEATGEILPQGSTGIVRIVGESVTRGYWSEKAITSLLTDDLGRLDAQGRLTILGRRDAVIITGGKKVHPTEVEAALQASGEFTDVAVVGVPDEVWGSAVVACFPPREGKLNTQKIEAALAGLAGYKRPKKFVVVSNLPRNAQGKLNRAALVAAALAGVDPREQAGR
ncbi:MAG: AMP-binding protein [Verrucomicrobia bacterium]|nr:AMP-binding protein [Verrucomicrobiota bacterium]